MNLIDRDELINDIEHRLWDWDTVDGIVASTVLKQTISDIRNQPTIEAIPIEWVCNYIRERKDIPLKNRECVSDMFDAWVAYMAEKEEMEE